MPILMILIILLLAAFGPILIIWSINTLFGLGIDYNFWTWLAVIILGGVFKSDVTIKR